MSNEKHETIEDIVAEKEAELIVNAVNSYSEKGVK